VAAAGGAPQAPRLPPIWLASSTVAAAIAVAFGVARWVDHYAADPNAEDFRVWLVAARVGIAHGWNHLYDIDLQRAASAGLGPIGSLVDVRHLYVSPPPSAWLVVPLTPLPIGAAYLIWTVVCLAAFVGAGWLVCPGPPLTRMTLLLASLALWPVHYQFWLGQWVVETLVLLAVSWWFLDHGRWVPAGVVLALAFGAKPQIAFLVPVALLVSGRWKPVAAFGVTGALLAAASAASLGSDGIAAWYQAVTLRRNDPQSSSLAYSYIFGRDWLATGIEVALGATALFLAWYRRERLDLVFALGIVGTTASATYLHEDDMAILVLAAWIVLRSAPSLPQRIWLLVGVAAAQLIAIGLAVPMLLWEPVWIVILGAEPWFTRHGPIESAPVRFTSPSGSSAAR
jgi:hypothetical protein